MPLFKPKANHPAERQARELRRELERLRAEIRRVGSPTSTGPTRPAVRSPGPNHSSRRPQRQAQSGPVNESGLPKIDLAGSLRRWISKISGSPDDNRQMVRMLAAGSIEGLPILRREKRRAFYSLLLLSMLLLLVLWGIAVTTYRSQ